ncbi:MAG: dihydrolipoyl dehydrogenase [Chloroflexi bacterium]|nr:dihydrolipoyl dehydrogenase [Chloroflexota bacterium]
MSDYDLLVLGAGPGGYVAAIRAAQLGLKTAIIERESLGGVCLNWGCIPSKALLRNAEVLELCKRADEFGISFDNLRHDFGKAIDRSRQIVRRLTGGVGFLLKKNGVEHIIGEGVFRDENTLLVDGEPPISADNIIIATGARPRELPNLPVDNKTIITSREAMELREVPKRIVIVGGGAIGVEFADIYHSYGAEVTIVEFLPRLIPLEDEEISQQLERAFSNRGINFKTDSEVRNVILEGDGASVMVADEDGHTNIECDKVLVAVGIQGNTEGFGFDEVGIEIEGGYVQIDDSMQTNVPGVYAIGDVTGKLPLAHVATAQGVTAVEGIAGLNPPALNYEFMPRAIYCRPQVASFGLTEDQAKERGHSVKIGMFPFMASGKALAMGDTEGMVKLVVDEETGEVLGTHMIGPEVTELLGEVGLSRLLEGTTTELGWLVHPHPSISEAVKEAALAVDGRAIHV